MLGVFALAAVLCAAPLPASYYRKPSKAVRYADGAPMRHYVTADGKWRVHAGLDEIGPLLPAATQCYEDRYFMHHPGVNPLAIARAAYQNVSAGRVISGGSTITMQLARILKPGRRSILSKAAEAFRAVQLELRMSKERILERYLNEAPYGGNHEGAAAASWAYFGKPPARLSIAETAYLVSLPQSPAKRMPGSGDPEAARAARNRVIDRMAGCALVDEAAAADAKSEPIPDRVRPQPFSAPHAADWVLKNAAGPRVDTTLDRRVQERAERIVRSQRLRLETLGAKNAAAVVIENRTREIKALVGNIDFYDSKNSGQVIGFDAPRSPGSALKPFLYALAIERSIITPDTVLEDAPATFGPFKPVNFSGRYEGLVRAEKALSHSLNIPFVHLMSMYGVGEFLSFLREGGIKFGDPSRYGLSVITGGLETTLVDLSNLYATLASGGVHEGYAVVKGAKRGAGRRIIDEGAAFLARRALMLRDRPDAPLVGASTVQDGRIAWKTGTSWGTRDAWAFGFNRQYTVGVWAGNFTGEPSRGIVGASAAAPIMFDIIRAVTTDWEDFDPPPAGRLGFTPVCSESGYRATPDCPGVSGSLTARDTAPSRECPYHKSFMVERDTGERACISKVYGAGEVEKTTMAVYPPAVSSVLGGKGRPPPVSPRCAVRPSGDKVRIVSPSSRVSYVGASGVRDAGRIPLQGYTTAADARIGWFVNDEFIGETRSGEVRFVSLPAGRSRVIAVSSSGRRDRADVTVSGP